MVARGRGKKAAASEAVAAVGNGVVSQENETAEAAASVAVAAPLPAKKGRARGNKKEAREEVDETPPLEIAEKPAKASKATKGSKKTSKAKAAAELMEEIVAEKEEKEDVLEEEDLMPLIETKPDVAAVPEKKASNRKRKVESTDKAEENHAAAPVAKKIPKTKTKAAKKETVDSAGIPEDPAFVATPVVAEAPPQTNGSKKPSTSRKRAAPKVEEPIAEPNKEEEPEEIAEPEEEIAPPASKKSSKSKAPKKESKKTSSKSKGSKKALKEEDPPEDDVLPEDEFVPELDEEEGEQPAKAKKIVKSKGSRKQLKDDIPPVEEEVTSLKEDEEVVPEKQDSDVESAIEEEKQTKGRKPAGKKASTKKLTTKKTAKAKKVTKDEPEEEGEIKNEESDVADLETTEGKTNGNAKPKGEPAEKKAARGGGRKRTAAAAALSVDDETDGAKSVKAEVLLNPTVTEYNDSSFALDKDSKLKISSWNIAGLRSWLKKDGLKYLQYEQPDIFCLQEIKCTTDQLPEEARIPGYHPYWLCMPGGHAGVAVYSKIMPINIEYGIGNPEHDDAGRMITAEYEKFYLVCVYVPNSGRKLVNLEKRMKWEELFRVYVQQLDKIKPVIIAGDMNVAHKEIDLANPKTNTKNAGFTPEERDAMTKLLELGYVDTFRHCNGEQKGAYSFWSYMSKARLKNIGWRLDYFIVSERIISKIVDSTIRAQVLGSDHCPITLFLNI